MLVFDSVPVPSHGRPSFSPPRPRPSGRRGSPGRAERRAARLCASGRKDGARGRGISQVDGLDVAAHTINEGYLKASLFSYQNWPRQRS